MEAGAAGGAPQRTRTTRRVARYGMRWRARDMAQRVRFWLAHASIAEITGATWTAFGPLLFAACWASGPLSAVSLVPGPAICATGALMCAVARTRGWRR